MRRLRLIVPFAALVLVAAACSNDNNGGGGGTTTGGGATTGGGTTTGALPNTGTVDVLNAMEPEEATAIQQLVDENLVNADYAVQIEASADFEQQFQIRAQGGNLDVALLPQPGTVAAEAAAGDLTSLESMGFDIDQLNQTFGEYFMSLGEYNGQHYGLPTNINLKSMIWYPKDDFDKAGYAVPQTWDELLALSDQIVADGSTPWCVGFESGGATGWPATDWMEDIMLRTAGPDVYDQWVNHEIPFNDPAVVHAGQLFGDIMFHPDYVLGGAENTPSVNFGDAPGPMFKEPPGCWLHRQASFINAFFPADAVAGTDYDWFPFPTIDDPNQQAALFAGELAVVGTAGNRPEVKDFLSQFIDVPIQCAMGGVTASSRISPNINVGPDCYANSILADASQILTAALASGNGRFDASDMMPAAVGSGSFWTGMVKYMQQGPDSLDGVLADIESSWPAS